MKSSKKIKVDAELWHSIIEGAEIACMEIVRWSQELEDVKKAYLLLTAAHDQATSVNADLIQMQSHGNTFSSGSLEKIESLQEQLLESEAERAYYKERAAKRLTQLMEERKKK